MIASAVSDVPALSVVVPTRGRPERLRTLLRGLARQGATEVVVVIDGPDPETEAVLAAPPRGLALRVERHAAPRGPAAARNTGWRAARAPLVAFTDDDCEPAPGWLAALAAAEPDGAVVQGRVEPHPAETHRLGPFARTLRVEGAGPWFQTANIRYPRALLERLGGFDEAYPHPAGEDTDLGWRAREAGAPVVYEARALIWHAVHPLGVLGCARGAGRWGSAVGVVRRHPGLRAHLTHRIFWKPAHERLLVGAAGLALARSTRGASLAATLPYLALRVGGPTTWPAVPGHLLVDAAEVAAMARGSLRARTLLL
jgi:glycosyltransferase involved in cell wall biosynthesis